MFTGQNRGGRYRVPPALSSVPQDLENQLDVRPPHLLEVRSLGDRVEVAQDKVEAFLP